MLFYVVKQFFNQMDNRIILNKYAVNYLSKYDTSKKNLEKILLNKIKRMNLEKKEKIILYDSIASIITELESKKIINDKYYAESKIRNFSLQGKSKYFIKSYLVLKGIEKDLIKDALKNFELENPDWEIQSAKIFIRKKRLGMKDAKNMKKDLAKMARAGFGYNISKKTLGFD